jgi:hypothetical protein
LESVLDAAPARAERVALSWTLGAAVAGATAILVGLLWDISWHATIGRDSFWTPAHLAIYLGGVLAGLSSGWLALRTTFGAGGRAAAAAAVTGGAAPTAAANVSAGRAIDDPAASVRFWGFRAPFGAWVTIWGAFAMLTSAPFDDWWHNAYGLDVQIISPPHVVLAAGIFAVAFGVMLQAVAVQNRSAEAAGGHSEEVAQGPAGATGKRPAARHRSAGPAWIQQRTLGVVFAYTAGLALLAVSTLFLEYSEPNLQHGALFYKISCAAHPLLLVAAGRAVRLRWPATVTAAVYTAIKLAMIWILPLFPAQPRLAPIFNPVTHMWPPFFPLLLVLPAVVIDLLLRRFDRPGAGRPWLLAAGLAAAFLGVFLAVQWLFSDFMLTPAARNWFFAADQWTYRSRVGAWHHQFWNEQDRLTPAACAAALVFCVISARIGLAWGGWMARVRR